MFIGGIRRRLIVRSLLDETKKETQTHAEPLLDGGDKWNKRIKRLKLIADAPLHRAILQDHGKARDDIEDIYRDLLKNDLDSFWAVGLIVDPGCLNFYLSKKEETGPQELELGTALTEHMLRELFKEIRNGEKTKTRPRPF